MSLIPVTRLCRIPAINKNGRKTMPAGFREHYGYQVIGMFIPNGSQDPHFYVVNESGKVVPLRCETVVLLDPNDPGYRNEAGGNGTISISNTVIGGGGGSTYSGTTFAYEYPILVATRTWSKDKTDLIAGWGAPVLPPSYIAVQALCLNPARKVILPHELFLSGNSADARVTAKFTTPVTGSLAVIYRTL